MSIKVTLVNRAPAVAAALRAGSAVIVQKTGLDLIAHAQAAMDASGGGRPYQRGTKVHVASAPGQAPAVDTGNLRASMAFGMTGQTEGEVTVGAAHGRFMEPDGTVHIAPRPFLEPAADVVWPSMVAALEALVGSL